MSAECLVLTSQLRMTPRRTLQLSVLPALSNASCLMTLSLVACRGSSFSLRATTASLDASCRNPLPPRLAIARADVLSRTRTCCFRPCDCSPTLGALRPQRLALSTVVENHGWWHLDLTFLLHALPSTWSVSFDTCLFYCFFQGLSFCHEMVV